PPVPRQRGEDALGVCFGRIALWSGVSSQTGVDELAARLPEALESGFNRHVGTRGGFPFAKNFQSCSFKLSQRLISKWVSKTAWHDSRWKLDSNSITGSNI